MLENPEFACLRIGFISVLITQTQNIFSFSSLVNKLKQEADVMINIPDDRASSNCIRIEGNKDGVKQAKEVCKLGTIHK